MVEELLPGDLVEVRSEEEIKNTLGKRNRLRGLGFMHEMEGLYGQQFRVLKKVERLMIETTGEMRTIKYPTYILEGAYCHGEYHKNCDRSCFFLWRGEWLRKVSP
jgi:hypothetical protein